MTKFSTLKTHKIQLKVRLQQFLPIKENILKFFRKSLYIKSRFLYITGKISRLLNSLVIYSYVIQFCSLLFIFRFREVSVIEIRFKRF